MFRGAECRERLKLEPTAQNQRYAVRLRGEILNAIGRGTFNYTDFFPDSKNAKRFGFVLSGKTVGQLFDEQEPVWVRSEEVSTWFGYKKIIDRYLRPWFGTTRVRDLTFTEIQTRILSVEGRDGKGIVLKTARNILSPLNIVLELAVARGEIAANPMDRVKLEVIWPKDLRDSDWEADPFTFDEMLAIFAACRDDEEADYWRAAFGTGMRTSEQIAMAWPMVDLVGLNVRIEVAEVTGLDGQTMKGPKTAAGRRVIPMTRGALEAFQRQHDRTGASGARVFLDSRYGTPWRGEQPLRKRFERILRKAGVRYRNPYQTRHTFASVHLAAGRPPLQVAKWMGHATTEMITRTYGKWIEQGQNPESRAALDAFFHVAGGAPAQIIRIA